MAWIKKLIQTDRGQFEYFVKGKGDPILVTHLYSEFNETGDLFADSFTSDYQVFLLNLRGCGESEQVSESYQLSMLEAAFDVDAVREALGFNSWAFAGHSTGAILGVIYGIHYADRIRELFLVSGAAREYMSDTASCIYHPENPLFQQMQDYLERLKRTDLPPEERRKVKEARTKLSLYHPENYAQYFDKNVQKQLSAKRLSFFSRELHIFDVTRKLPRITCNTLVICGRYDVQCPLLFSEEIAEFIPHSELVVFDNSNHYPFLEENQRFLNVISEWKESLE